MTIARVASVFRNGNMNRIDHCESPGELVVVPVSWSFRLRSPDTWTTKNASRENLPRPARPQTVHRAGPPRVEIESFLDEYSDESPTASNPRRYSEEKIPLGESVYDFGDAETSVAVSTVVDPTADAENRIVTTDMDTEMFLISDKSESELVEDRKYALLIWPLVGIAVFSAGFWWFLSTLGV